MHKDKFYNKKVFASSYVIRPVTSENGDKDRKKGNISAGKHEGNRTPLGCRCQKIFKNYSVKM
jgi:hypothetical protein